MQRVRSVGASSNMLSKCLKKQIGCTTLPHLQKMATDLQIHRSLSTEFTHYKIVKLFLRLPTITKRCTQIDMFIWDHMKYSRHFPLGKNFPFFSS